MKNFKRGRAGGPCRPLYICLSKKVLQEATWEGQ